MLAIRAPGRADVLCRRFACGRLGAGQGLLHSRAMSCILAPESQVYSTRPIRTLLAPASGRMR